ncbi:hypothetical protein SDJN03_08441, partial [Cucurbita argyrosperma subsp. sororia]
MGLSQSIHTTPDPCRRFHVLLDFSWLVFGVEARSCSRPSGARNFWFAFWLMTVMVIASSSSDMSNGLCFVLL